MKLPAVFLVACSILLYFQSGLTLQCFSCQQSYRYSTACSNILPALMSEECEDSNATCIVATEQFQNGSLQLVRRACWTGDFCNNYPKQGELLSCRSCDTDLCNNEIVYDPISTCET